MLRGTHFLQIVLPFVKLFEIEKLEPKLCFDSDLAAIIKHKCNRLISVYDCFSTITVQTVSSHLVSTCLLFFGVRMCRDSALSFLTACYALFAVIAALFDCIHCGSKPQGAIYDERPILII